MDVTAILQTGKPCTNIRHYYLSMFVKLILFFDRHTSYEQCHSVITSSKHKWVGPFSSLPLSSGCRFIIPSRLLCPWPYAHFTWLSNTWAWTRKIKEGQWDTVWLITPGISSFQQPVRAGGEGKGVSDLSLECLSWNFKRIWSIYYLPESSLDIWNSSNHFVQNKGIWIPIMHLKTEDLKLPIFSSIKMGVINVPS